MGDQLLAVGTLSDFARGVHPTSCTSTNALAKATALLASQGAIYASGLPANGEQAYAKLETCYLHNGVTRAREAVHFEADAEVRANLSRRVGARRTDAEVFAERNTTNTGGSACRENNVRYNLSRLPRRTYQAHYLHAIHRHFIEFRHGWHATPENGSANHDRYGHQLQRPQWPSSSQSDQRRLMLCRLVGCTTHCCVLHLLYFLVVIAAPRR